MNEHDPALVELVATTLAERRQDWRLWPEVYRGDARAVLAALRDAGYQVLPPGWTRETEWAVQEVPPGNRTYTSSRYSRREDAELRRKFILALDKPDIVRREIIAGPWRPDTEEETP